MKAIKTITIERVLIFVLSLALLASCGNVPTPVKAGSASDEGPAHIHIVAVLDNPSHFNGIAGNVYAYNDGVFRCLFVESTSTGAISTAQCK